MKYVRELEKYYKESMATPLPDLVPFEKKLRVSGFPYCALKHSHEVLTHHEPEDGDSSKSFYCDVGTAAHLIFQRWMGCAGRIYGDWLCSNKKCKHIVHFSNKNVCPKCKSEMLYEEFTVKYGKHLSGHLDGVFKSRDGKYWVIDYKTSSVRVIYSQKKFPTFPYAKNRAQIQSYCALIEKVHNIEIAGWMLLYIARDDPKVFKIVGDELNTKQKRSILKKIDLYDEQYGIVLDLPNSQDFSDIEFLIDTKACKTQEYYYNHMKAFTPCPLEAVCFTPHLDEFMEDTFSDYIDSLVETNVKKINTVKR